MAVMDIITEAKAEKVEAPTKLSLGYVLIIVAVRIITTMTASGIDKKALELLTHIVVDETTTATTTIDHYLNNNNIDKEENNKASSSSSSSSS